MAGGGGQAQEVSLGLTAGTRRSQGWDPGQLNSSFFACLFIWLCWVLVAICEIFGVCLFVCLFVASKLLVAVFGDIFP